jgi:TetR/AcrR family transcriptional regulator, transcriptional repressor for nem operon
MPLQKVNKDEIISKSIGVFTKQGYNQTTMNDLAEACGLQKGSFYHYFDGKESLMKAVLEAVIVYFRHKVFAFAYDEMLLPKERLEKMRDKTIKATIRNRGCFIGATVLETSNTMPVFKELLQTYFDDWSKAMAHIYETKYQPAYAMQLAQQTVMEIEGAMMLMKLSGNEQLLFDCYERAIEKI